ncbi:MAG: fluoride efflux transporter CrcB [Alphaproteobacteria bacterium]
MPGWSALLWVALGGALGSVGRLLVTSAAARAFGSAFPWGTVAVNVAGSFAMGVMAVWVTRHWADGTGVRLFLMTGLLGGFTTFSAFSLEAVLLLERGQSGTAFFYMAASVVLSLGALGAGLMATRSLFPETL